MSTKRHGRRVLGGVAGFFFGVSLSLLLLVLGVLPTSSVLVVVIPIVAMVFGVLWAWRAPLGKARAPAG